MEAHFSEEPEPHLYSDVDNIVLLNDSILRKHVQHEVDGKLPQILTEAIHEIS